MITGTHINYYHVCKRELWLFANGIQMEHTSELVDEGRFIHETAYPQRAQKYQEIEIEGVKIDYYDARNKIVHEIKKSNKVEEAHRWQVKYYLLVLRRNGVKGASAILEYPRLKRREEITLSEKDVDYLTQIEKDIQNIVTRPQVPPRVAKKICRNCSYYDFCWVEERF